MERLNSFKIYLVQNCQPAEQKRYCSCFFSVMDFAGQLFVTAKYNIMFALSNFTFLSSHSEKGSGCRKYNCDVLNLFLPQYPIESEGRYNDSNDL